MQTSAGRKARAFTRSGRAGANRFVLAGRGLKVGGYRLVETAVDATGNRSPKVARPLSVAR